MQCFSAHFHVNLMLLPLLNVIIDLRINHIEKYTTLGTYTKNIYPCMLFKAPLMVYVVNDRYILAVIDVSFQLKTCCLFTTECYRNTCCMSSSRFGGIHLFPPRAMLSNIIYELHNFTSCIHQTFLFVWD